MKKIWMGLAAAALVASLCVTGALAAGHRGQGLRDADGDGVCDNHGTRCAGFTDANGGGVCDNYGTGLGSHRGGHGRGGCRNH